MLGFPDPTFMRAESQTGRPQTVQQFAARNHHGTAGEHGGQVLLGNVVVVTLEAPPGYADRIGKPVQFVEGLVRHQVTPSPTPEPPTRFVDQHRHAGQHRTDAIARPCAGHTGRVSDEIELRLAWSHVAPPATRSDEIFDDVVGRHRQSHRRYHGVRHVVWVLRHVHALATALDSAPHRFDMGVVVASAFFHDAVYEPRAADNEVRSAELATRQLRSIVWPEGRVDHVADIIAATAHHLVDAAVAGMASSLERQVVLDADLAILGSGVNEYQAYATGVRAEYSHLDEDQWSHGRRNVLTALLDRSHLYATTPACSWWDGQARANMAAERAALHSR